MEFMYDPHGSLSFEKSVLHDELAKERLEITKDCLSQGGNKSRSDEIPKQAIGAKAMDNLKRRIEMLQKRIYWFQHLICNTLSIS